MKKSFREYHQFTEKEYSELWGNCIFAFDTNTLLNMYRYSRETVEEYFTVLKKLRKNDQLWIPYQVGYEFHENRINVICEYEKSYDEIIAILDKVKADIEIKYKDHPFLDLSKIKEGINRGLSGVEQNIKIAKKNHPEWIKKDEVLETLDEIFQDRVGKNYTSEQLEKISKEGEERYRKNIPPGYKDDHKPENKKYGDLIMWNQLIDKAKKEKKPIILISGDVKEDWWLEKDGKRIMPLPQLKKEMLDKAGVDFHIYTADRFLELSTEGRKAINQKTIAEVRKIRELEERRMMLRRIEMLDKTKQNNSNPDLVRRHYMHTEHVFKLLEELLEEINELEIDPRLKEELIHTMHRSRMLRNRIMHGETSPMDLNRFSKYTDDILHTLYGLTHSENIDPEISARFRQYMHRIDYMNHRMQREIE